MNLYRRWLNIEEMEKYKKMLKQLDINIMYIFLYSISIIYIANPVYGKTVSLGVVGKTWPVVEQDITIELKSTVREKLDRAITDIQKNVKKYQPSEGLYRLPVCKKNTSFTVDMTWTLTRDLRDNKGKVIYPKGYRFNPLQYVPFSQIIVVIDATDSDQVTWFKQSLYSTDSRVLLLLSDGYAFEMMSELKRPVYYLSKTIAERLKLRVVPSVISRVNKEMEVFEFDTRGWAKRKENNEKSH